MFSAMGGKHLQPPTWKAEAVDLIPSGTTKKSISLLFPWCVFSPQIFVRVAECYCSCHQKHGFFKENYELCGIIIYLWLFNGQNYLPALLLRYAAGGIWGLSLCLVFRSSLRTAFPLASWLQATTCSRCWLCGFPSKVPQRVCTGSHVIMGCGTL